MKQIAYGIGGAILGYVVIALTLGWFIDGTLLAAVSVLGALVGIVLGVRQARQPVPG